MDGGKGNLSPKVNSTQTSNAPKTKTSLGKGLAAVPSDLLPATSELFPYVVAVKVIKFHETCEDTVVCTGMLYDYNFVLTAGI